MDWTYIDNIDKLPAEDFVHCDTRDFFVLTCNKNPKEKNDKFAKLIRSRMRQEQFLFRRDEILGTLKALEMGSEGPGDWRMLRLKPSRHYDISWLKYIRFAAVDKIEILGRTERVYVAYADCCGQYTQLSRQDLTPENLDNEHLNHMPFDKIPRSTQPETPPKVIKCDTLEDLSKVL